MQTNIENQIFLKTNSCNLKDAISTRSYNSSLKQNFKQENNIKSKVSPVVFSLIQLVTVTQNKCQQPLTYFDVVLCSHAKETVYWKV